MKKEFVFILAAFLVMIVATYVVYQMSSSGQQKTVAAAQKKFDKKAFIYFYGAECPHCKEFSKWLVDKGIDKKVKYQKLEVWHNSDNQALMEQAVAICKLDTTQVGVPFIYDKGKCVMGTPDAEKLFQTKFDKATAK